MSTAKEFYDSWLSALLKGIKSQLARYPSSRLYALIDGAQIEGASKQIRDWKTDFAQALFSDTKEASLTDISPWLVSAHQGDREERFLQRNIELQGATHSVTWIISPLSADALYQSLRRRMDAKLPGNMEMLLRYFDTYRLPDLHRVLDEVQRKDFFGCANAWLFIDRQGELAVIDSEFSEHDSHAELVFSEAQEHAILDASFPDELLRILEKDQQDLVESLPPQERYDRVKTLIEQAKTYGIEGAKDLLYFCIVGLSEGDGFDSQPEWANILTKVKTDNLAFADAALAQTS